MSKPDYYQVLGLARNANEQEIKKSYKRLAMKYHPDRNPKDEKALERFKEIKEAYEVLSDRQKRSLYDQYGHAGLEGAGSAGGQSYSSADFGDIFGDVFGDIFGAGRGAGQRESRGADLRYNLELTLEEAVRGVTKEIKIPTYVQCETCHGTGARKGSTPKQCTTCHGVGQVQMRQGFFAITQTCPQCHGRGHFIEKPCSQCHGQGRYQKTKTLSVKIPAGVDTGDRVRLASEGEMAERGGVAGDLYVQIHIKKHPIFVRDGNNLYCEVPISYTTAALGGDVEVPTLDGRVNLKVPPETQTDRLFRIKSKGVTSVRSHVAGDLICKVVVETPVHLTEQQRELLRQFEESCQGLHAEKQHPKREGFFKSVKRFFDDLTS